MGQIKKDKETKAERGTKDLKRQFISPSSRFQSRRSFSPNQVSGSIELGWHRGHQSGIYDAYKSIRKQFPEAAEALLKEYGMNKKGAIVL